MDQIINIILGIATIAIVAWLLHTNDKDLKRRRIKKKY